MQKTTAIIVPVSPIRAALTKIWTRDSRFLLGGFFVTLILIIYIWWPLAEEYFAYVDWNGEWWRYMDWLLLGIFGFMTVTIIARAELRTDLLIVFVGICGGLAIESWGTQTNLWFYYTGERPPLWIIPAWPIASLSIDRITRGMSFLTTTLAPGAHLPRVQVPGSAGEVTKEHEGKPFVNSPALPICLANRTARQGKCACGASVVSVVFKIFYWLTFVTFLILMLVFIAPTFDNSYTWFSLALCVLLILTPTDHRFALLTFIAGAGLGYFLESWGTTRECWTYYTYQTPPLFAVLAHGMAAVAFWRAGLMLKMLWGRFGYLKPHRISAELEPNINSIEK